MSSYPVPNVIAQNPRGERVMDVYSHLLTERVVYLGTPIDAGVANALVAQLLHLEADAPDRVIQLYINCEGGDPTAMLAVLDTMRYIRPQVATTCVGQAVAVGADGCGLRGADDVAGDRIQLADTGPLDGSGPATPSVRAWYGGARSG